MKRNEELNYQELVRMFRESQKIIVKLQAQLSQLFVFDEILDENDDLISDILVENKELKLYIGDLEIHNQKLTKENNKLRGKKLVTFEESF